MRQSWFLWAIVSVSLVAISLFPIYTILVLAPRFEQLLVENTKDESIRLASYFSTFVVEGDTELRRGTLPHAPAGSSWVPGGRRTARQDEDLHPLRRDHLLHRADRSRALQPGSLLQANGGRRTVRAEIIPRQSRSLENEDRSHDVVETYVPIGQGRAATRDFRAVPRRSKRGRTCIA